jgi:L-serine deaminase
MERASVEDQIEAWERMGLRLGMVVARVSFYFHSMALEAFELAVDLHLGMVVASLSFQVQVHSMELEAFDLAAVYCAQLDA